MPNSESEQAPRSLFEQKPKLTKKDWRDPGNQADQGSLVNPIDSWIIKNDNQNQRDWLSGIQENPMDQQNQWNWHKHDLTDIPKYAQNWQELRKIRNMTFRWTE